MEMQTDNPSLPYTDPEATPDSVVSPESFALHGASSAGDVSRVRTLLSSITGGAELPIPAAQYLSQARFRSATNDLQDASVVGDAEKISSILQAWRADPSLKNPTTEDMAMALILAAQNAKGTAVRFFLDEGVPVGLRAPKLAAKEGDGAIEVFQVFLDHGWDINSFDRIPTLHKDGHTPLDFAVTHVTPTTPDVIDLLLSSGALPTYSNALHNALITIQSDEECKSVMELLLNRGFDVNFLSFSNQPDFHSWNPRTPLH